MKEQNGSLDKHEQALIHIKGLFLSVYRRIYCFYKRVRLKNKCFSLICNNCAGGVVCHDLGIRFNTPTVNLLIPPNDYIIFLRNLHEALDREITEERNNDESYPVGVITLDSKQSVHIHFVHYSSFQNAKDKWEKRVKRIQQDNLFVLFEMGFSTSDELIEQFISLPYKHKMAITNRIDSDEKELYYLDIYNESYQNGKSIFHRNGIKTYKRYIDEIDFVKWFNEA